MGESSYVAGSGLGGFQLSRATARLVLSGKPDSNGEERRYYSGDAL